MQPDAPAFTMLFTDIEGSTQLARELGSRWPAVVADHHRVMAAVITAHGGTIERTTGDGFFALFGAPIEAVMAAVDAQRALSRHKWPGGIAGPRVRMAVHQGSAERSGGELAGLDIHLAARVEAAGHGGQILFTTAVRRELGAGFEVADLGPHRLKDFPAPETLFQLVYDGRGPDAFPPLRTQPIRPTNLPSDPHRLIGRDSEVDELCALLRSGREPLVTLVGLGGIGKTRVAAAAAARLLSDFDGGVWLVRLAGIDDPDAVLAATAAALGVADSMRPLPEVLAERLQARATLLLLDNFEQVVDAAPALSEVLAQAPACRALVTSQLPLRVSGEHVFRLGPLRPEAAVALFDERASSVLPQYDAGAWRGAVVAVCERLDGLPLAVELAAARVPVMSPVELHDRLEESLELLGRGGRDAPERQRSLLAALRWTWGLLGAAEQDLLARLAVFAGPAPVDAIEPLAAIEPRVDAVDALTGLLDASLVRRTESREVGIRFVVPQAVRPFAAERLAESGLEPAVRRAHAQEVVDRAVPCRMSWPASRPEERRRVLALEAEQMPALAWARGHDRDLHLRVASALSPILERTGRTREAHDELTTALAGRPIQGPEAGWAATVLGITYLQLFDREGGRPLVAAGLEAVREAGDDALLADALIEVNFFHMFSGDNDTALSLTTEALALARRLDDRFRLAKVLIDHAQVLVLTGQEEEALRMLDESQRVAPDARENDGTIARVHVELLMRRGDFAQAAVRSGEAAIEAVEVAWPDQLTEDLVVTATALANLGADDAAVEIAAMKAEVVAETRSWIGHGLTDRAAALAAAEARLPGERIAAAKARGRAVPPSQRGVHAAKVARAATGLPSEPPGVRQLEQTKGPGA